MEHLSIGNTALETATGVCIWCADAKAPTTYDTWVITTGKYDKALADLWARGPMMRLGQLGEFAKIVTHVARPLSAFATGQGFAIGGGWST